MEWQDDGWVNIVGGGTTKAQDGNLPANVNSARAQQAVRPIPLVDGRWMRIRAYCRPGTIHKLVDTKECAFKTEIVLLGEDIYTLLTAS